MMKNKKVVRKISNIYESNSTAQRKVFGLENMKEGGADSHFDKMQALGKDSKRSIAKVR